jgi:hypothetical protein
VSRLDFAPKLEAIEIIDIKKGLGKFTPKPDKPASFAALRGALKKAGYQLDSAEITLSGSLVQDGTGWWLEVTESKQRFALAGELVKQLTAASAAATRFQITGDWQTSEPGKNKPESIRLSQLEKIALKSPQQKFPVNGIVAANQQLEAVKAYTEHPQIASLKPQRSPGLAQRQQFSLWLSLLILGYKFKNGFLRNQTQK